MSRIICIEGPDNIGKTALCNELDELHDAKTFHLGAPKEKGKKALNEQLAKLGDVLLRVANTNGIHIEIWDRSVIGESVYGPLYRDYNHEMYWNALQNLKRYEEKIFFVVMYADAKTYIQWNVKPKDDEKEPYQLMENAALVARRFVDVASANT